MHDNAPTEPTPGLLKGPRTFWVSLALLAAALVMSVPIYGGWLSGGQQPAFRVGLAVLWGGLALVAVRRGSPKPVVALFLGLFGVSLGLTLAYVVGNRPLAWLGLSVSTPTGAAVDKILSEVIPVCTAIFAVAALARLSLEFLGLRGGRAWVSLGFGLLSTIPLLILFALDPSGGKDAVVSTPVATLGAWLPWIVVFSIGNGFMEELWFRGLWFGAFRQVIGSSAATHVTSLAFCLLHVLVYWDNPTAMLVLTPAWLFMGYAYAWIMRKTGSLWGPVVSHAVADMLFLLVAFSTGQM